MLTASIMAQQVSQALIVTDPEQFGGICYRMQTCSQPEQIDEWSIPTLDDAIIAATETHDAEGAIESQPQHFAAPSFTSSSTPTITPLLSDKPNPDISSSISSESISPTNLIEVKKSQPEVVEIPRSSSASSESSVSSESSTFPPITHTSFPVANVPNWGAMRTPAEWNRSFKEMTDADFVRIPSYASRLTSPSLSSLAANLTDENMALITAKLTYSTAYFGAYDVDAGEFTGMHAGIDIKLAEGTPIGAIGGGRVSSVGNDGDLGLHIIIEHQLQTGERFYSIYGHLGSVSVKEGQDVQPGQYIGNIGMTGKTTAPHLHLAVDRAQGNGQHIIYHPMNVPSPAEAAKYAVSPIEFIEKYREGE